MIQNILHLVLAVLSTVAFRTGIITIVSIIHRWFLEGRVSLERLKLLYIRPCRHLQIDSQKCLEMFIAEVFWRNGEVVWRRRSVTASHQLWWSEIFIRFIVVCWRIPKINIQPNRSAITRLWSRAIWVSTEMRQGELNVSSWIENQRSF